VVLGTNVLWSVPSVCILVSFQNNDGLIWEELRRDLFRNIQSPTRPYLCIFIDSRIVEHIAALIHPHRLMRETRVFPQNPEPDDLQKHISMEEEAILVAVDDQLARIPPDRSGDGKQLR
jgi:hypothetical protein